MRVVALDTGVLRHFIDLGFPILRCAGVLGGLYMGAAGSVASLAARVFHVRRSLLADKPARLIKAGRMAFHAVRIIPLSTLQHVEIVGVLADRPGFVFLQMAQPTF